jgi:hypothetical protein
MRDDETQRVMTAKPMYRRSGRVARRILPTGRIGINPTRGGVPDGVLPLIVYPYMCNDSLGITAVYV